MGEKNDKKARTKNNRKKDPVEIVGPKTSATFMPTKLRLLASRRNYDDHKSMLLTQLREVASKDEEDSSNGSEYYEAREGQDPFSTPSRRDSTGSMGSMKNTPMSQSQKIRSRIEKENYSMREEQRDKLSARSESESSNRKMNWIKFRIWCGTLINHDVVQIAMIAVIIINSLFMGVATFDFVTDDPQMQETFKSIDRIFLVIYTIELLMQFAYYGWRMIQDAWLAFDLFIVVVSWVFDFYQGGGNVQIIRAFRIFRSFRLLTRIKVLRDLVAAISQVIPRLCAVLCLLLLIFYIFSVLFTELFREVEVEDGFPFATLHDSLFTSVELMTLEWGDFARECMVYQPRIGWIPFVFFIFITGFIVVNLIIAVICDAVSLIDQIAREREAVKEGVVLESKEDQLHFAQCRIVVLEERVKMMQQSHDNMQNLLETLAAELYIAGDVSSESSIPRSIVPNFSGAISGMFGGKDQEESHASEL
mmetsp:Transcript_19040/g.28726  ORF Transcript_19040/g.28726 Transcript_19040/m.28726 type:complete len:477 (-) Transcript_19040:487-1917(-)|eukprot:CAMPEP_0178916542 /NCGR_PEP_ID=MMETSP0786-20121207/12707_1 /TAXON_ID=186022 /ORGANISM="Thalassionema frauenfeldii, Strain CCMP 1798" /LENGTH=476 /DNA_ID=CAMNT_0020589909 /DNA_START=252 /DNA_END=1682 /DNA_ORIENTATION=-